MPPRVSGDVLARTLYSGISAGTEMLAYRGEIDPDVSLDESLGSLSGTFAYPFSYGYSCVARVEESDDLAPGTLIFAFHPHQDRLLVDRRDVVVLGGVDPRLASLFPLVETALQISLDAGAAPHDTVAVMGLGPVGLLTALMLGRSGAQVIGIEPLEWRRRVAEQLGFRTVEPDEAFDAIHAATGRGVDLVIEVSGRPETLQQALRLLAHEGIAVVASWYGMKPVTLDLGREFHRRRLAITSSQVSTIPARLSGRWTFERRRGVAADLLAELPLKALATHEFPFREARHAYDAIDRGEPGLIHAALRYDVED